MKLSDIKIAISKNDRRVLGRLISYAENREPILFSILKELYSELGQARVVGFTGPPGAGKSTLVNDCVRYLRQQNENVGVVAVDPVSPFTGGALLGDRIRLTEHFNDNEVFIRSLSTRGKLGGLSVASRQVIHLLDAFGFKNVLIETVGVGQSEVDVRKSSDVTVVVLVPEWGDSVQALKSGLLEIGDVFVVNKKDREGADRVAHELKSMLEISHRSDTPVLTTSHNDPASLEALWKQVFALANEDVRRMERRLVNSKAELIELVADYVQKEGQDWLKNSIPKQGNPYSQYIDFTAKHPPGTLFNP